MSNHELIIDGSVDGAIKGTGIETGLVPYSGPSHLQPHALATRARSDDDLLDSWVAGLASPVTRKNFRATAAAFLEALRVVAPGGLRAATVEDVRDGLDVISANCKPSSARQYQLRVRSMLTYAHRLGYCPFNAGATIKVHSEGPNGGALASKLLAEVDVALLLRATRNPRDRAMLSTSYAAALRISELVGLRWDQVIEREGGRVQLSVLGKGSRTRQILLPVALSQMLLSLPRGEPDDPVFPARHGGPMSARSFRELLDRIARRAGLTHRVHPHLLRHAHASHALDCGAALPTVQATLGHANVSTTSIYLHAKPNDSSGLVLDQGVFADAE